MRRYINYLPNPLLEDLVQGRCIPIIGAGFSRNANLPSGLRMPFWNDVGKSLAEDMNNYPFTTPIDAISAFSHEFSRVKLIERLRSILHVDVAQPGSTHLSFANLPFDTVITTNFDFLLERSYDLTKRPYYPIVEEEQLPLSNILHGTRLVKIHGDVNHPSRLIVTEQDYDTFIENYPLICTYIANLLISRTPLFIGYSLDDPDFRQIWQIIGNRLGNLRRAAYTLAVGIQSYNIARYNRRGIKVISLGGTRSKYGNILKTLFEELNEFWMDKIPEVSTITDEKSLIEFSLPRDAQIRLCFFAIPFVLLSFYRSNIFPIFKRYGFTPITATDIITSGENITAKISSLIERATLVVADISSSKYVISEINMALTKKRKVIIIKEERTEVPFEIKSYEYIERPRNMDPLKIKLFISKLEEYVKRISRRLVNQMSEEPIRLLNKGENRAAVLSAFILLETELRERLPEDEVRNLSLSSLLNLHFKKGNIPMEKQNVVTEWRYIRNQLVHTKIRLNKSRAERIVKEIMDFIQMFSRNSYFK